MIENILKQLLPEVTKMISQSNGAKSGGESNQLTILFEAIRYLMNHLTYVKEGIDENRLTLSEVQTNVKSLISQQESLELQLDEIKSGWQLIKSAMESQPKRKPAKKGVKS